MFSMISDSPKKWILKQMLLSSWGKEGGGGKQGRNLLPHAQKYN